MIFQRIEAIVARASGHDVSTLGSKQVERAVVARMAELGLVDPADYERRIQDSTDEIDELIERVVVNESWFFRDIKPFEYLVKLFEDAFARRGAADPVRIISVPCSAGEEAYSIAIALADRAIDPARYRIEAADISDRVLDRARSATYRANAFRSIQPAIYHKWILKRDDEYEVSASIRGAVRFFRANLLEIDPAALEAPYDVVFCRNLLIYLDTDARRRAGSILNGMIAPGGYLFLGHADPPGSLGTRLIPVDASGVFAYRDRVRGDERSRTYPMISISMYDHVFALDRVFGPRAEGAASAPGAPVVTNNGEVKL